eukprot:m.23043 g.23043  ORF g.23043 m.23043 type:complete len:57 (+) comp28432_c0_seq6:499-669(+)
MEAWIIERDADGYGDGGRTDADWPELRTTFASGCFVDVRSPVIGHVVFANVKMVYF